MYVITPKRCCIPCLVVNLEYDIIMAILLKYDGKLKYLSGFFKGNVFDGLGRADHSQKPNLDIKAPGILARSSINELLIMFPIGRGQRELTIGDRQTGKTSLTVDNILNQNGTKIRVLTGCMKFKQLGEDGFIGLGKKT